MKTRSDKALIRPLSRRWHRGPAWLEGDIVVVDFDRGTTYDPLSEPTVGLELMRVRNPDEAVTFAGRFGLLIHGAEGIDVLPGVPGRAPVQQFVSAAGSLQQVVETVIAVRKAATGDVGALTRLRQQFVDPKAQKSPKSQRQVKDWYAPEKVLPEADDRTLLLHASQWSGWQLSMGMKDTRSFIYDRAERGEPVPPGNLRIGILPRTLLDACYMGVALALTDKEPISQCPECLRFFVVEDGRQQYCTPKCASRFRFRKHDRKRKEAAHGKKTRTR